MITRELDGIAGLFKGQPAFVLGGGPSAVRCDERLGGFVTLAVNSAILRYPNADYFVTADVGVFGFKYWQHVARDSECGVILPRVFDGSTCGVAGERVIIYDHATSKGCKLGDGDIIRGTNSAHCATHIARRLGCDPIYLLGCDCRDDDDKRMYAWQVAGDDRGGPTGEHPTNTFTLNQCRRSIIEWNKIYKANPSLRLYDCSNGALGNIRAVPTADLEEVLSGGTDHLERYEL